MTVPLATQNATNRRQPEVIIVAKLGDYSCNSICTQSQTCFGATVQSFSHCPPHFSTTGRHTTTTLLQTQQTKQSKNGGAIEQVASATLLRISCITITVARISSTFSIFSFDDISHLTSIFEGRLPNDRGELILSCFFPGILRFSSMYETQGICQFQSMKSYVADLSCYLTKPCGRSSIWLV